MKIYISIPVTGHDETRQREKADRVKAMLSRAGHTPVNPFEIYNGKDAGYADMLCNDLRALACCDAIYLCENWQFSRGCRIEANFAKEFGKQIMYENQTGKPSEYYFER